METNVTTDLNYLIENKVPLSARVKLIEARLDQYIIYVFKDLDSFRYYIVTRFPSWKEPEVNIGEEGYLEFFIAIAGKTKWYDKNNIHESPDKMIPYNNTYLVFNKFIKDTSNIVKKDDVNCKILVN